MLYALDLVEAHLEGPPLDETGLVDDPHIGDIGLGGPAVEPGRAVQYKPRDRREGQGKSTSARRRRPCATAPERQPPRSTPRLPAERTSSAHWSNTAPSRRAAGFVDIARHSASPELTRSHSSFAPFWVENEAPFVLRDRLRALSWGSSNAWGCLSSRAINSGWARSSMADSCFQDFHCSTLRGVLEINPPRL